MAHLVRFPAQLPEQAARDQHRDSRANSDRDGGDHKDQHARLPGRAFERLTLAFHRLLHRLDDHVDLGDDLAAQGAANRFRDVVGIAPARYLTGWRMDIAMSLLIEGRSVKEVAPTVRYRYQPAFSKAFSSWCGMAPTEWLRQPS